MTMISQAQPNLAAASDDSLGNQKHCVFRCDDAWFSVPAMAVREIVVAPQIVRVPHCHPALAGLAHLRSEFVPVARLQQLLDQEAIEAGTPAEISPTDCLLIFEGSSVWSLLISDTAALASLETIVSPEAGGDARHNSVIGTAMFQERIVRVLSPTELLGTAQRCFEDFWTQPSLTHQARS